MSSSKKKISDQIPRPMTIKKEKSEEDRTLQPISHYIDDRLELVKQIFGTLKPKTIMNLAPEFLKKTSLDEIEELCLNELLCISTKRLKSIIADTRCPTDTESSEDSDVEHKQEHVSLEEISSDSDIGGSEKRRAKKLRKSSAKKTDKTSGNNEPSGQISVLELLELQARARAIRSQLAMEPITKIEVKSDDDDDEQPEIKQRDKEKRSNHRNSNASKQKSNEQATSKQINKEPAQTQANGGNPKPTTAPAKKIKLKRNYRTSTKSPERKIESNPPAANVSKPEEVNKEQPKSRSASPDVIPIAAEPETLLISDSTDDEAHPAPNQQKEATPIEVAPPPAAAPAQPAEESEPEEGEVRDEPETVTETQTEPITVEKEKPAETELEKQEDPIEKSAPAEEIAVEPEEPVSHPTVPDTSSIVDDEDQNDDVISIGGDLEMIEELSQVDDEPAVKVKSEAPVKLAVPDEEDNDVISLNTSDDDTEKLQEDSSESWRTRYLKSSKVSQVLAASRLGKRVRDKIKKSNRAQKRNESKDAANEKALQQQQQEQQQQFTSKHEDGSMEQYKELLQHRQRKSSNSSSSRGDK